MKKLKMMVLALIFSVILSACGALGGQQAPVRTINVSGQGEVYLNPDVAYVYVGVHTQSSDVAKALKENNIQAQAVASSLQELGVESKDIQTTNFNVYPQPQTGPQGEILDTQYMVDNTVYITLRDLQKLGDLLSVVVRSGANRINGITFDVLDKSKALSEARKNAIDNARAQAEELTKAAGVKLGQLQTMNVSATNMPVPMFEGKGGGGVAPTTPVSAGQLVLRVDANLTFEIK
jgi:uncharacterized protein YggE